MEKYKVYARQIPPEWQGYTEHDEYENPDIIVLPPPGTEPITPEWFRTLMFEIKVGSLYDELSSQYRYDSPDYSRVQEILSEYFPERAVEFESFTRCDCIYSAIMNFVEKPNIDTRIKLASEFTGKEYTRKIIHGCTQREWALCLYPKESYTDHDLEIFAQDYFGNYEEWEIHEENYEPENADQIVGYVCRIYDSDQRKEIAEMYYCKPEEVKLWKFREWQKIPVYTEE